MRFIKKYWFVVLIAGIVVYFVIKAQKQSVSSVSPTQSPVYNGD